MMRNFRAIEAFGMLLVLFAWVASFNSVQTWTDARDSHQRQIAAIVDIYQHVQISANVGLEAAIDRELLHQHGNDNSSETSQPYQRAWQSPDVRRAWLRRANNSAFGLSQMQETMARLNGHHNLIPADRIRSLATALTPINGSIQALVPGGRRGWIPAPTFNEDALSPQAAEDLEMRLARVTNDTFAASDDLTQAISRRREKSWRVYAAIFLLGTALLIIAKLLNWRIDVKASSLTRAVAKVIPPRRINATRGAEG